MGQRKQIGFPFPLKGKHEGAAFRQQPEGTTPDALNVRAFDAIANRLRGGQRNGLSKYIAAAVNGVYPIQAISQLTTAFDPNAVIAGSNILTELFPYTAGWMGAAAGGSANWAVFQAPGGASLNGSAWYLGVHAITGVSQANHTFTITTRANYGTPLASCFPTGSTFVVSGSTGNDGTYTVASGSSGTGADAVIKIAGSGTYPPSAVVDGTFTNAWAPWVSSIGVGGSSVAGANLSNNRSGGCAICQPAGVPQHLSSNFVLKATFRLSGAAGNNSAVGFLFRVIETPTDGWGGTSVSNYERAAAFIIFSSTTQKFHAYVVCGQESATSLDLTTIVTAFGGAAAWNAAEHTLQLTGAGNTFRLYLDGASAPIVTHSSVLNAENTRWGFAVVPASASTTVAYMRNIQSFVAITPQSLRTTGLIVVSGGSAYAGSSAGLTALNGGSAVLNTSGAVRMQQAFGRMYFVDGNAVHYKVYNPLTGLITAWVPTTGSLPAGSANLTTYAISASNVGASRFTTAASTLVAGDIVLVTGDTALTNNNNGTYQVVSNAGGTALVVSPAPLNSAQTTGSVSLAQRGASIIVLYRGRIVLSGLSSDPQNWFMSAAGNPLDWNYTPTTITQTMAVAGNNSTAGLMGDVITCLAPYNDDLMFMGGDHTLWVMRGDPAAGGLIDNISYQTGVAGPDAWCRSSDGDFYFFGTGTFWMMPSGSTVPQPLSRGIMDKTFGAIDYATYQVRLLWDDIDKGVHLYLTPASQPGSAPIHYFWDKRAGGFWPDQYPAAHGPTAVWNYDADLPTDRAFLLGGFDSYIRQIPAAIQKSDDGTAIHSYVCFAPQVVGGDLANSRLSELTPIMSSTSDPVALRVFAAGTPAEVAASATPQVSRVLAAGRNGTMRQRVTGNALALEIESEVTAWVTATYYAAGVQVTQGGILYTCLIAHTSGTFATDLTAVKWEVGAVRSWAVESITGVVDVAGKTRSGRL